MLEPANAEVALEEENNARAFTMPTTQTIWTTLNFAGRYSNMSVERLAEDLDQACKRARGGDLGDAESTLTLQARTLDLIFHTMARKAGRAEMLSQLDTYMRLALKAQAQCRASLEALAAIKNPPPVAFVRQANIANGHQQVVNGRVQASAGSRKKREPAKQTIRGRR